jgi:hypothetical protein
MATTHTGYNTDRRQYTKIPADASARSRYSKARYQLNSFALWQMSRLQLQAVVTHIRQQTVQQSALCMHSLYITSAILATILQTK